ncbi:hypothetical protein QBC46DRAFT_248752 [Diplogelasinospora grovesii]|uniref:Uncharacterized protein n=1 Tax=Diplogelasinospora grovesii TaxID=303347 RepID=A0AAN6NHS2_9PEZI|nr:hypothetical protein QBC46DRAFT_248752 [Diplogelasinospora grovesii]
MYQTAFGAPDSKSITPSEVQSRATEFKQSIFNDWRLLEQIVQRHEPTIQRRWTKKSKNRRRKDLESAWPGMSPQHQPDLEACRMGRVGEAAREACMWPYINLEDLSEEKPLCLMINSRGRNHPSAFAMAEVRQTQFSLITHRTGNRPRHLRGYSMVFTGREDQDAYGELIREKDEPGSQSWVASGIAVSPGKGLWILEIQARLYRFLVDVAKVILHDIPVAASVTDPLFPILPEPAPMPADIATCRKSTLATLALEAPYRLPATLDFSQLQSIIEARLAHAEDHVLSLREDPGYFAAAMEEWKEHTPLFRHGVPGAVQSGSLGSQASEIWHKAVIVYITNALGDVVVWHVLRGKIAHLVELKGINHAKGQIQPGATLPQDYQMAFCTLIYHLRETQNSIVKDLRYGWATSPPMRPYLQWKRPPNSTSSPTAAGVEACSDHLLGVDRAVVTWERITDVILAMFDEDWLQFMGIEHLMDETEHIRKTEPAAKKLITSWVADQLGSLSIVSECTRQINLYQPWAAGFELGIWKHHDKLHADYVETTREWQNMLLNYKPSPRLTGLGIPTKGKFRYPADKRRTKENVEAMRKAEDALDEFWAQLQKELTEAGGMSARLQSVFSRPVQRTPEWVAPANPQGGPVVVGSDPSSLATPFQGPFVDDKPQRSTVPVATSSKSKLKTRGVARSPPDPDSIAEEEPVELQPEAVQETTPVPIKVSERVAKVFSALFFSPSPSAQPGEIPWSEFLFAMGSIGFTMEQMQGSAWRFSPPSSLGVGRNILFHEPHPAPKLPFHMARCIGRRLSRAYGWTGETFVVE